MRFEEEFRCFEDSGRILEAIQEMELPETRVMEVCGTHTMSIARSGIRDRLPKHVKLISGPGCPVCVTPVGVIDEILRLSQVDGVTLTTYGDLMRVPGSRPGDDLQHRRAMGADVRVVYSPMDALDIAKGEPNRSVIFLGVGFETTAPGTALAVLEAQRQGIENFFLLCLLKQTVPALQAIMAQEDVRVDGFLCPGHVSIILGADAFRFLAEEHGLAAVVAGFETADLAAGLYRLLCQRRDGTPRLENEYTRAVTPEGNTAAQAIIQQVLEPCDDVWRGLGHLPESGWRLRSEFSAFDAALRFGFAPQDKEDTAACRCGDVICGRHGPEECPMFGKACMPEHPMGPCMVSSEGACAAAYQYGRLEQ